MSFAAEFRRNSREVTLSVASCVGDASQIQAMAGAYGLDLPHGVLPFFWSDPFCLNDFRRPMMNAFLPRLTLAFVIFLFGLYMNNLSQAWLQSHIAGYYETGWKAVPPMNHSVTLWDVTFYSLPYVPYTKPADIVAGLPMQLIFVRFLLIPGPMSLRWTIVCRVLVIWASLWFCRAFTILVTPLPNPDYTCKPRISFPDNVFLEAYALYPFAPYDDQTCQDVLFSGHTVGLTLGALTIRKYIPRAPWLQFTSSRMCCGLSHERLVDGLLLCIVLLGYYLIIASHFHYTVDVLVAAILTILIFNGYHTLTSFTWFQTRDCPGMPLFRWFEGYSKDIRFLLQTSRLDGQGIELVHRPRGLMDAK